MLKGLHGKVGFSVQRVVEQASATRHTYLELTGQFERGYLTASLQEVAAYYSNRLSYEEVAGLLQRLTGERVLSDQRIEQWVIEKAVAFSQARAEAAVVPGGEVEQASLPTLNRQIDLYAAATPEVLLLEDGISVKAQKPTRQRRGTLVAASAKEEPRAKRIITEVIMLERRDGRYQYLAQWERRYNLTTYHQKLMD